MIQSTLRSSRLIFHTNTASHNKILLAPSVFGHPSIRNFHVCNNNNNNHPVTATTQSTSSESNITSESSILTSTTKTLNNNSVTTGVNASTEEKLSLLGKIKRFIKEHGFMGLFLYFSMYFSTLGLLFVILQQGLLPTRAVLEWLSENGFRSFIGDSEKLDSSQKYANFVLAYIVNRLLEPIRLVMTYRMTPKVSQFLRRVVLRK
ncbi:hypothetical protein C9374_012217 [Naegleria lovaniensis]|uniref:DUF1279 domain-containing protein n=1 Tax=Naegleria lovaniensis TaxID=51637 RepID=A0AA88GG08_NAELO|nr:uncharacterized protein C9374_012217 [Naegleria lovaniensis]KAG2373351.1 hypothetical protein C9374_012217 [Naegleria lovaniensis]